MSTNLRLSIVLVIVLSLLIAPVVGAEIPPEPVIGEPQCMTYDCPAWLGAPCVCENLRSTVYLPVILK